MPSRGSVMCNLVECMMGKRERRYKWDPIATNGTRLEGGADEQRTMIRPVGRGCSPRESCPRTNGFMVSCRDKAKNTAEVRENGKKGIRPPERNAQIRGPGNWG